MRTAARQAPIPTWEDAQEHLRDLVGEEVFRIWFSGVTGCVEDSNGVAVLRIVMPTRFQRDNIRDRFGGYVETAWRRLAPTGTVAFTIQTQPVPLREAEKLPAKVIQFPLFPEETRPVANNMARSALFSCVQGKDRRMLDDALLASQDGVEIRFTGKQLNQDDHDLLMLLVKMGSHKPLGEYTTVPAYAILKSLGRGTSGRDHQGLRSDVVRLFSASISLRDARRKVEYFGHLVDEAFQDETSRYWVFKFNPKLRPFYDDDAYTLVDWEQRKQLKGKDLARWLHLYIVGHAEPFPVSVAYLREMSGSQTAELWKFRQLLKAALDDLKADPVKIIVGWHIDENDLVHIDRGMAISDSQRRHLTRPKRTQKYQK